LACALGLALQGSVHAHEGHDHGPAQAEPGAATASPRVAATSETYQLVGIVEGEVLVVYLDRAATNEAVTTATIEGPVDGQPSKAEPQKNGTYEVTAAPLKRPGQIEVLASIVEGETTDLLVGALAIPSGDGGGRGANARSWSRFVHFNAGT